MQQILICFQVLVQIKIIHNAPSSKVEMERHQKTLFACYVFEYISIKSLDKIFLLKYFCFCILDQICFCSKKSVCRSFDRFHKKILIERVSDSVALLISLISNFIYIFLYRTMYNVFDIFIKVSNLLEKTNVVAYNVQGFSHVTPHPGRQSRAHVTHVSVLRFFPTRNILNLKM